MAVGSRWPPGSLTGDPQLRIYIADHGLILPVDFNFTIFRMASSRMC